MGEDSILVSLVKSELSSAKQAIWFVFVFATPSGFVEWELLSRNWEKIKEVNEVFGEPNSIILLYESEDMKNKVFFSKYKLIPNLVGFQVHLPTIMCGSLLLP